MAKTKKTGITDIQLASMSDAIAELHDTFFSSLKQPFAHAAHAGKLLSEAKEGMRRGEFTPWVTEQCGMNLRTAQWYMQAARESTVTAMLPNDVTDEKPEPTTHKRFSGNTAEEPAVAVPKTPVKEKGASVAPKVKPDLHPWEQAIIDGKKQIGDVVRAINEVRKTIDAINGTPVGRCLNMQDLEASLKNANAALRWSTPFSRCVYCPLPKGKQQGCKSCHQTGWISRGQYKLAPANLKAMAEKLT